MTDILLSKPNIPDDFIDVSVGEAHLVRDCFLKHYGQELYLKLDDLSGSYPHPAGQKKLLTLLEEKYKYPVLITNGAKQALGAAFYALNKTGKSQVFMRKPYWALIPPLLRQHNLSYVSKNYDSILCLAPNNPDGHTPDVDNLHLQEKMAADSKVPFIHDAAYFTHTYLPKNYRLDVIGDMQIFSISKMYGMSGVRLGYIVCKNTQYYSLLKEYLEMMTVGVSSLSQEFLYKVLSYEKQFPKVKAAFEEESSFYLKEAKKKVKNINKDVLEVPDNFEETPGMFLWAKVGKSADFNRSKVYFVSGEHFGMNGYVRMNVAQRPNVLQEIINRLNS